MGLFSWLKKKQIEEDRYEPNALPGVDMSKVIPSSPRLVREDGKEVVQETSSLVTLGYQHNVQYDTLEKPVFKFKAVLSNKTLTVFLPSGDVIVNSGTSKELFEQVRECESEQEIKDLLLPKPPEPVKVKETQGYLDYSDEVKDTISEFIKNEDFTEKEGLLYLNGIDFPIPALLAKELLNAGKFETSEYYDSLKYFWCWCVLNPDARAREDLFGFLTRGDFKIDKNGFFIAFRNVNEVKVKDENNKALVEFVSAKYLSIKTKQKKSPKNYSVFQDESFTQDTFGVVKVEAIADLPKTVDIIGNLAELYTSLSDMEDNEYTDQYSRTMKIKIGVPVKMDRDKCDSDPADACSRGLHVKNRHHSGEYGVVSLVCAVNPMNVVAVPLYNNSKMRVCEYLPLGVVEGKWEAWIEDTDTLTLEEGYVEEQLKDLLDKASSVKNSSSQGANSLILQVAKTLQDFKDILDKRVVKVS